MKAVFGKRSTWLGSMAYTYVEYQVAANEGHSIDHVENRIEFLTRVARFLDDHVKAP